MTSTTASRTHLATARPDRGSTRRMLLLLAAVFFLPFAVGSGLFWSGWRPAIFANHGELLQPPRVLPESGLRHSDGRAFPTSALRGKWLLVVSDPAPCRAACREELQQMRQLHVALNKEQSRVQPVFISSDTTNSENASALIDVQNNFPGFGVGAVGAAPTNQAWHSVFTGIERELYVVDPLGNVVMRYPASPDMRGVLKDMERLLKYSWLR